MANNRVPKYPRDLADNVFDSWDHIVAGEYVTPPCPSKRQLRAVVEAAYLTASVPEEGRFPKFNLIVTPKTGLSNSIAGLVGYRFESFRKLSVDELRRLAPATDQKKSAIWIVWDDSDVYVAGICDLGTSWHRARMGFTYSYNVPSALIIQIERPGRMKVYQGAFAVASLKDGELSSSTIEMHTFMHSAVKIGLDKIAPEFSVPEYEHPREFENFWWIALWNVFAAIANSISSSGHGGMLIITSEDQISSSPAVRIKYPIRSKALRRSFVKFINSRNVTADCWTKIELGHEEISQDFKAELALMEASDELVEAIRTVAQFAGCDGAIAVTSDLNLVGFGVEIRAELARNYKVQEVNSEFGDDGIDCDIEQFGMRHRSAIKLASSSPDVCILAVSQDSPISAVWSKDDKVLVKKGVTLPNMNLPWS